MIDKSKRTTLKAIAATTASVATGGVVFSSGFGQHGARSSDNRPAHDNPELGNIEVSTRISATHNDLEVVLTNAGNEATTITQMTPSVARVARGELDFAALLKDGPLRLNAGQSVTVPLQRKPVQMGSVMAPALSDSLKNSMSIVTDNNAFASVSVMQNAVV